MVGEFIEFFMHLFRVLLSGVSIIADVAEFIAETQPISINRIEIWDRLIGKISKRTSLQRSNCYWHEYTSMYIDKDGGAQCVADNEDAEREIVWNTSLHQH